MDIEKTCGNRPEENTADKKTADFNTSFLTLLAQLGNDEEDEEPVDNTQD